MGLVGRALKNPYAVVVAAVAILIIGVTVVPRMGVDILPTFRTPAVQILTFYPGMPAEIVEQDISTRLERWTGQANGVARQESKSMIGVAIVKDYFRPDIDPKSTSKARVAENEVERAQRRQGIRAEVAAAQDDLDLAERRLEPADEQVTAAEDALRSSGVRFRNGTAILLEVIAAQREAELARLNRLTARVDVNRARTRLKVVLGD